MQFVAFDLEITQEIPEGTEDWKSLRPLGISCAATLTSDGELKIWHGADLEGGRLTDRMHPWNCQTMARYLIEMQARGYPVVTWNGLGFDFDVLAEEVQDRDMWDAVRLVALDHIDVAWAMFCEKGFMCGLNAAAQGMGLQGKTEGMHGDLAPVMWAQGREEQDKVLEYVAQDVRVTADVYRAILEKQYLRWITKSGTPAKRPWQPLFPVGEVGERLLTVSEAAMLGVPDTSWMDDPWPRSKFLGWTVLPKVAPPLVADEEPVTLADIEANLRDISDGLSAIEKHADEVALEANRMFEQADDLQEAPPVRGFFEDTVTELADPVPDALGQAEIEGQLDKLAELRYALDSLTIAADAAVRAVIPPEVQAEVDAIRGSYGAATADVAAEIEATTAVIKEAVLALGQKVKGAELQAVWVKGRASWNDEGLQGYAVANPTILTFFSQGKPSVSIKKV